MNKSKLLWNQINWKQVESRIDKIQAHIYNTSLKGDKGKTKFLQTILIKSLDAKLLAVRRVTTENKGKNTAGLDGTLYITPEQKASLVSCLKVDGLATPIRRVWIPKPGKPQKRPLGIPIIKDRAKQKLVLMALEPAWEAKFEPNSYGFRPGRSAQDAIEAIFLMIRNHKKEETNPKYILDADLKGCFDNIDHDYLLSKLQTTPRITAQVKAWLKAGIFEGFRLDPPYNSIPNNEIGTPQGGVISPFLANVALHGMENHLKEWITKQDWPMLKKHEALKVNKAKSLGIVRYADDFVVIHKDKDIVLKAKEELSKWLNNTSKLQFNDSKTKITDTFNGIKFLGFTCIHILSKGTKKTKIFPSLDNQKEIIKSIGDFCREHRSLSTYDLIQSLRPKAIGWANYFKFCECKETFSKIDRLIHNILRAWVFRRDRRHGKHKVKEKYFPSNREFTFQGRKYKNQWTLVGKKKSKDGEILENHLPKLAWVQSEKFVKVKDTYSVYNGDDAYWSLRTSKYGNFSTRKRTLLKRQKRNLPNVL
jgi:RNA-directed DNA polymerase